jgi:glutamyl-tRNA reductase
VIGVVGLNHKTSAVAIREKLAFDEEEIGRFAAELKGEDGFEDIVVLSTCNRTEIYFNSAKACGPHVALLRRLCRFKCLEAGLETLFYSYQEEPAVRHLFSVASGLDSMVLGENEILGQVKEAYRISSSRKLTSTVLNRLFHKAFEVGKAVRTETGINRGATSTGTAAVDLASRIFSDLEAHPILLVGAGETAELVLRCLMQRGGSHVHIANRTLERAEELARAHNAEAVSLDRLMDYFLHCDIVILAISSRTPLVQLSFLEQVMHRRGNRSLLIIDLSVPRSVEAPVKRLDEVFSYDIDDLEAVVAHSYEKRKREVERADAVVEHHTHEFFEWLSGRDLGPTIMNLKQKLDAISGSQLSLLRNRLPEESYQHVEEFGKRLQSKYLALIVRNLKTLSQGGRHLDYVDLVNNLFGLRGPEDP